MLVKKLSVRLVLIGYKALCMIIMIFGYSILDASMVGVSLPQYQQESADTLSSDNSYETIARGVASFGIESVSGRVHVVTSRKKLRGNKICKGDIVVAVAINSLWYHELTSACAIITEKNDANALSLGRKLGIPVITGVIDATKILVDGQIVICDPLAKSIAHVFYPAAQGAQFNTLVVPVKDESFATISDKLSKPHYTMPLVQQDSYFNNTAMLDHLPSRETPKVALDVVVEEDKQVGKVKTLFSSNFESFKKYVMKMKHELKAGRHLPRFMLKSLGHCDDFAIDCIPISLALFDSEESEIVTVLKSLDADGYVTYMTHLLEKLSEKPRNMNALNWVARISHEGNVKTVPFTSEAKKREVMKDPTKYEQLKASLQDVEKKAFVERQKALIAAGLFARFCVEKKLVPQK